MCAQREKKWESERERVKERETAYTESVRHKKRGCERRRKRACSKSEIDTQRETVSVCTKRDTYTARERGTEREHKERG